jgi:hypothetical protein
VGGHADLERDVDGGGAMLLAIAITPRMRRRGCGEVSELVLTRYRLR